MNITALDFVPDPYKPISLIFSNKGKPVKKLSINKWYGAIRWANKLFAYEMITDAPKPYSVF